MELAYISLIAHQIIGTIGKMLHSVATGTSGLLWPILDPISGMLVERLPIQVVKNIFLKHTDYVT